MRSTARVFLACAVVGVMVAAACVSTEVQESVTRLGTAPLSAWSTGAGLIHPGRTTRAELEETFGLPTVVEEGDGGAARLIYAYERRVEESKHIPFVMRRRGTKTQLHRIVVQVRDGIVTDIEREVLQ